MWILLLLVLASPVSAADFRMDPAGSRLLFRAVAENAEFSGEFTRFDSSASFDPADLPGSRIEATVDMASVDTANGQRDELLLEPDWFHTSRWPRARFVTDRITPVTGGGYRATGRLSLRNITRPVVMTLRWEPGADGSARLRGTVPLKRLDFDVGIGEWRDTKYIADGVTVEVDVRYLPAPAEPTPTP